MIETRHATIGDKDFLWKLKVASMRQYVEAVYGWDDAIQYGFFEKGFHPEDIQIIQYGGNDIGMCEYMERTEDWFLARIEILSSYQGRGIGTTVIQLIIGHVSNTGKPLRLQVFKINPAQKLYGRIGFIRTGETKTHITMELPNNRMQRTPTGGAADAGRWAPQTTTMTTFGIAIYLDPDEAILKLVNELKGYGLRTVIDEPGQVFHISLVNAESNDLESIIRLVADDFVATDVLHFDGPCQFDDRNVAYLKPHGSGLNEIMRANMRVNEYLTGLAVVRPFYQPQKYQPHMSLAGGYHPDMRKAISELGGSITFSAKVIGYGIASWSNGHVNIHKQWAQQGGQPDAFGAGYL